MAPDTPKTIVAGDLRGPPGLPPGVTRRPRLDTLYRTCLERHPILAVFAGAGSGKTTQARLFTETCDEPVAWLTLTVRHRVPELLLRDLAAAVAPHLDRPAARPVERPVEPPPTAVLHQRLVDLLGAAAQRPLLLVLDQCDRIDDSRESCALLDAVLEHLPPHTRLVLTGRTEPNISLGRQMLSGRAARIPDGGLDLTRDEGAAILARRYGTADDLDARMDTSRGWMAGFLLHDVDARPLRRYLRREILEPLSETEREALLDTAVLDAVSPRVESVFRGLPGAGAWQLLEGRHLPARQIGDSIVYSPCLREFLRDELHRSDEPRFEMLSRRYLRLLREQSRHREIVEILLDLDDLDEAAAVAARAVPDLLEGQDWERVLRWVAVLGRSRTDRQAVLLGAEIIALRAVRNPAQARELVLRLLKAGRLGEVLDTDPRVVTHAAWALLWRPTESLDLLDRFDRRRTAGDLRYLLQTVHGDRPTSPPRAQPWAEGEALTSWGMMLQGRMDSLAAMVPEAAEWPPSDSFSPHPLIALVWRGELDRARRLLGQVPAEQRARTRDDHWFHVEAWLRLAEGRPVDAAGAAQRAIMCGHRSERGTVAVYQMVDALALIDQSRFTDADEQLDQALSVCQRNGMNAYMEWELAFRGKARLAQGRDDEAVRLLREAVEGMRRTGRHLMLPLAAVWLAEAEWRVGRCAQATDAADLAYQTSERVGSFFPLQWALRDFPRVLERQRKDPVDRDRWRRIRPATLSHAAPVHAEGPGAGLIVSFQPFGPNPHLTIRDETVVMRRLKVLELLSYVSAHPLAVRRDDLLLHLFPESDRPRSGNHYRQIVHQVRKLTGLSLERQADGTVCWADGLVVDSLDVELERAASDADGLLPAERLARLSAVLERIDGPYVDGSELDWVLDRRFHLDIVRQEAEQEVCELAIELGQYDCSRDFAQRMIERDPTCEAAYRSLLEIELAVGTPLSASGLRRRLLQILDAGGVAPDRRTSAVLERLVAG